MLDDVSDRFLDRFVLRSIPIATQESLGARFVLDGGGSSHADQIAHSAFCDFVMLSRVAGTPTHLSDVKRFAETLQDIPLIDAQVESSFLLLVRCICYAVHRLMHTCFSLEALHGLHSGCA